MNFRISGFEALLLAGLMCGFLPTVKAQSTDGTQHILFSSPNGQITSNAPLPMVQAPQPREMLNLPDDQVAVHEFAAPSEPETIFQEPMMQPDAQSDDGSLDSADLRKKMGALTAAQIMNVPTPEQIFGLAEKAVDPQKIPGQFDTLDNAATNGFAGDTNALMAEPGWAKVWTEDPGRSVGSSNTTERTSGFFGGFFDSARTDNGFGNRSSASDLDTLFGRSQSQPASQQSSWDSALTSGEIAPPTPAPGSAANSFAMPGMASSSELASQSPFTPPQVNTMDTLPQLPALPTFPGQNEKLTLPAAAPSWAPKAPPWAQAQTPFGTPVKMQQ